jgi:hypothetical protein
MCPVDLLRRGRLSPDNVWNRFESHLCLTQDGTARKAKDAASHAFIIL